MREARSIANAVFAFLVFLLFWALVSPEAAHSRHGARFLRMEVEEKGTGRTERHRVSVPTWVVNGVLRGASIGRFHRELDMEMDRDIPFQTLKDAWAELGKSPDGTEVTRTLDEDKVTFRKEGSVVTVKVDAAEGEKHVVLRLPASVVERALSESEDLDADAIIAGLRQMGKGDLVDVQGPDAHLRIWLE